MNGSTTCGGAVSVGKAMALGAPGDAEGDLAGELSCPEWQPPENDTVDPSAKAAKIVRNARTVSPVACVGLPGLMPRG